LTTVFVWEDGATLPVETNIVYPYFVSGNGISNRDMNGAIVLVQRKDTGTDGRKYTYQSGSDPAQIASPTIAPLGSLGLGPINPTAVNALGHVAGDGLVS